jgi:bacillithiol system protein YtxJ
MDWISLTDAAQLAHIDAASRERPVLIFKHSTRCSISSAALNRLESAWTAADDAEHTAFHLDLIRFRDLSNAIAERYCVQHESPQVLVIRNGRCVRAESHFGITYAGTVEAMNAHKA